MYIIKIYNNGITTEIHNPYTSDKDKKISSGEISEEINKISSFSFKLNKLNIGFDLLFEYSTKISVYNTKTKQYDFKGRVIKISDDMDSSGLISKSVICESLLGYLNDSKMHYIEVKNWTVLEMINHILEDHNSQLEEEKHFKLGKMELEDDNDNIYLGIQRETAFKTLMDKVVEYLDGELTYREETDGLYLDFNKRIGSTKSTSIKLAKNMKSVSRASDITGFITRLIPLGAKIEKTDSSGNVIQTEQRIGIETVNDGCEYIDDKVAISVYGIIRGYEEWDDVTEPINLLHKGQKFLEENNKLNISYDVDALELALIGKDIDLFELGNYYPVENTLLDIRDTLRIIKKTKNIIEPNSSKIELGNIYKTLTDIQAERNNKIDNMENTITDISSNVSNVAVRNVTNTLTSLIQQYADSIISTVAQKYVETSQLDSYKKEVSTQFEQTSKSFEMLFRDVTEQITTVDGKVTTNYNELVKYIRFVGGSIVLGEVGNQITLTVSNDRLSFMQNGVEVAYMSNNNFVIYDASFLNSLKIGIFEFKPRSNGSLDFGIGG